MKLEEVDYGAVLKYLREKDRWITIDGIVEGIASDNKFFQDENVDYTKEVNALYDVIEDVVRRAFRRGLLLERTIPEKPRTVSMYLGNVIVYKAVPLEVLQRERELGYYI